VIAAVTCDGSEFHILAPATGNARSPTVDRRVRGTIRAEVDADLKRSRVGMSETLWMVFERYEGAAPCRH